jgi:hypothetical protein
VYLTDRQKLGCDVKQLFLFLKTNNGARSFDFDSKKGLDFFYVHYCSSISHRGLPILS